MRVAFFLPGSAGKLFCSGSLQADGSPVAGRLLLVPPFAEEMNKSRHLLAAILRTAGTRGFNAILPDLYGTGDSEGDFSDATMDIWRSDLDAVIAHLGNDAPLHLVCLRAGALLGMDALQRHAIASLTLLQPQTDGRQVMNQFLRLRLAGGLLGDREKESAAELRERLAAGEVLEVAGYGLTARLADGLENLAFDRFSAPGDVAINWIEFVNQVDRPLMPISQRIVDRWTSLGIDVSNQCLPCDPFWATQEIVHCPGLATRIVDSIVR